MTCASRNCSAEGCRYTLRCAVHTPGDKSFSWSRGEQLDAEGPEVVVEAPPPGELDVLSYTCTVRNPVSSSNATVSPAALCAGESPQRMRGWGAGGMLAGTGRILIPAGHSSGSQKAERAWPPPPGWGALPKRSPLSPVPVLFPTPCRQKTQPALLPPVSSRAAPSTSCPQVSQGARASAAGTGLPRPCAGGRGA